MGRGSRTAEKEPWQIRETAALHLERELSRFGLEDETPEIGQDQLENDGTQNSESTSTDVWENLREIFADIDSQGQNESVESRALLKKPIMHLRRLLQIHSQMPMEGEEENELDKAYLGVLYEREWYLRKLQAIETAIGPAPPYVQSSNSEGGGAVSAATAFAITIRSIIYEDNADFSLLGSKWR